MAKNKNNKTNKNIQKEITVSRVKLPVILGIKPGVYLLGLYSVLLVLFLFFTLFYPGLSNYGSLYTFTTSPPGASVYVDTIRIGATPLEHFVPAGEHTITIKKTFFEDIVVEDTVPGGVFATVFFPARKNLDTAMRINDTEAYLKKGIEDFSLWSLTKGTGIDEKPYYTPNIPENTVIDLLGAENSVSKDTIKEFLLALLPLVNSETSLSQWISGWNRLYTIEETDYAGIFTALNEYFMTYPYLGFVFHTYSGEAVRKELESIELFTSLRKKYSTSITDRLIEEPTPLNSSIQRQDVTFINLPGGSFIMGNDRNSFPHYVSVEPFSMSDTEITNRQFSLFISANPEWKPDNITSLIAKGLVDENYLAHWNNNTFSDRDAEYPVKNVSWYAAAAYAEWIGGTLPKEYQWEWAASAGKDIELEHNFNSGGGVVLKARSGSPNFFGLYNLMGNLWEWMDDPYAESGFLGYADDNSLLFDDYSDFITTKTLRGGSWANKDYDILLTTRGSYPADWCTPFTGFRVVLGASNE